MPGLTDVAGIRVGHATDLEGLTGVTVVVADGGARAAVDVRGGAPGTRETDLLAAGRLVQEVHAVCLCGGSAFGLEAAGGVTRFLAGRGVGFPTGVRPVPIVPAAVVFDLAVGSADALPDAGMGARAAAAAAKGPVAEGSVGAGAGCSVGKLFGMAGAMRGGLGTWAVRLPDGPTVGALVVVNAFGDVRDPRTSRILAGPRDPETGRPADTEAALLSGAAGGLWPAAGQNTTLVVVATDAALDRDALVRVAAMAHDGLARAIRPVHTPLDGDTVFALATGARGAGGLLGVGVAAAEAVAEAVVRAVRLASGAAGIPAARDLGLVDEEEAR